MTIPPFDTIKGTWAIDAVHSSIGFSVVHTMVAKVRGSFDEFSGTIEVTGEREATVDVAIQTASIDTRMAGRDDHLRSADFFDAATYPVLHFHSTGITVKDDESFTLVGDLTIRDVTKPVSIEVEATGVTTDPSGVLRAGFEGTTSISRKEWGLTWNVALEAGGVLVSDKVNIVLDIAAIHEG